MTQSIFRNIRAAYPYSEEDGMREKGDNLFLLALSIYVLINVFAGTLITNDPEIKLILKYIALSICIIFFSDFFINLYSAKNKAAYLKWGWIDFISSIPLADPLRWGRLFSIVRSLRFLRTMKAFKVLVQVLQRSKIQSFTIVVLLITFIAYTRCASLILELKRDTGGSIHAASDALRWVFLKKKNVKVVISQTQTTHWVVVTIIFNKLGLPLFSYFNAILVAWLIQKHVIIKETDNMVI